MNMKNHLHSCIVNRVGACLLIAGVFLSPLMRSAKAQGLVQFANTSSTLISDGLDLISGPPGSYYFGLLIAPPGTTDPRAFTFTGLYATNTSTPGRLQGGSFLGVPVPGWEPGTLKSFMVCGWRAIWGHDWNPQFLNSPDGSGFAFSSIATAAAGSTNPAMAMHIFSSSTLGGFNVMGCQRVAGWLAQPTNQTVLAGTPVLLSAAALGCPPPALTWYFNGNPIANFYGTNTSLAIASAHFTNAGDYYAVARVEYFSSVYYTSSVAHLTVLAPPLITIERLDNQVVLTWPDAAFSLQCAPSLTSTYTNIPGALSPYTNPVGAGQQYFRLRSD